MSQFTPGPWIHSYHGFQVLTSNSEVSICELKGSKPRDEQIANAQLIAEAPSMLAALQMAYCKHHLGDDTIGWDELSEKLGDVLSNAMGIEVYVKWQEAHPRVLP